MKRVFSTILACLLAGCCAHKSPISDSSPRQHAVFEQQSPSGQANTGDLEIEISVLRTGDERAILVPENDWHFHVLITNRTGRPIELWEEWNSWGYYALSFEVIAPNEERYTVKKKKRGWAKNFPSTYRLAQAETVPVDVHWLDDIWENVPHCDGEKKADCTIKMRAVLEMEPADSIVEKTFDTLFNADVLWTGKAYSEWSDYVLR